MTPLRNLPVAMIDFESTDFPGPDTHVVDVAVVHATLGGDIDPRVAFASLVRPPVPIPERVSQIHGIRDADVADAPTWVEIVDRVTDAVGDRTLVAFNAPCDHTFWRVENERLGRPAPPWPWIDLLIVRKATKTRGRPGRLGEIAAEYGIALDAHGAIGDALSTALLFRPLMAAAWTAGAFTGPQGAQPRPRYSDDWRDEHEDEPPPRIETVEAFFAWQRGAALWQERSFADYCRRNGNVTPPRCDWHAIEGEEAPTWTTAPRTAPCQRCGAGVMRKIGKGGQTEVVGADGATHTCREMP